MQHKTASLALSEKGLLTPNNCGLIDLQPQMLFDVSNFDRQSIIGVNVALGKVGRVFDVRRHIDGASEAPFLWFASLSRRTSE